MKPVEILINAGRAGVGIAVNQAGKILASGLKKQVDQFVPIFADNKAALLIFLQQAPVEPVLKPCPICNGLNFIHGHKGGYYCVVCQPDARPGLSVKAGGYRSKKNLIKG